MQAAHNSADTQSARHDQNQEKNSDYSFEYFAFKNFYATEKIKRTQNILRISQYEKTIRLMAIFDHVHEAQSFLILPN